MNVMMIFTWAVVNGVMTMCCWQRGLLPHKSEIMRNSMTNFLPSDGSTSSFFFLCINWLRWSEFFPPLCARHWFIIASQCLFCSSLCLSFCADATGLSQGPQGSGASLEGITLCKHCSHCWCVWEPLPGQEVSADCHGVVSMKISDVDVQ